MKQQIQSAFTSTYCYDNALFYKGFLLVTTNQVKHIAFANPEESKTIYSLTSFHRRLATEYAKPLADRKGVDDLETKANSLEKELVRTVAGYGEALQQVTWQEVQATLTQGEVAVEFVRYHFYRPEPTDSIMYAALVLKSGNVPPVFVPLFEEKELMQITGFSETDKEAYFHQIYAGKRKNDDGKSLRDLIYAPLEAALSGVSTIYYAPDGLIHRINPDAIYLDEKATFADRFRLVRVNSTRQLVIPFAMGNGKPAPALIYGGIDYDADSTALLTAANIQIGKRQIPDGLGALNRGGDRGGKWRFLTNSEKEARAIEALFDKKKYPVSMLTGKEATEESLRAFSLSAHLPSPRVLHLATHGFFFPDPAEAHDGKDAAPGEVIFKENENPMLRAGLVMAGGNHAWLNGKAYKGLEDGILTAYEVSQLDLRNTELVTLSACETGLGEIVGNEGVFGLQRAFKIAGAHYIIMSLWKVPDQETQELMTLFYKRWLEGKMAIPDAFRSAQTEMRKLYPSPYYWAGFVLVE
ncbi:MAG: CHAT domain-containing protein [Saprospiraceae bacterium]|nr:CHAT domain-containing protein [Saprospiraceae bacterium]